MYEQFTKDAREVMDHANDEARTLNHEYLGTEHILLALVAKGQGPAANALEDAGITEEVAKDQISKLVVPGPDPVAPGTLPQTNRTKNIIEAAIAEARNLGDDMVGTQHILLGLLHERDGLAAQAIINTGCDPDELRNQLLNMLGADFDRSYETTVEAALPPQESPEDLRYNELVSLAVKERATDIHIEPTEDGIGRVRYRVDGVLHDTQPLAAGLFPALINRIKKCAAMDTDEQSMPQDGRTVFTMDDEKMDIRTSVIPTIHGERAVMKILRRELSNIVMGLDNLGLDESDTAAIEALYRLPNGLIIVTGPTGQGKTTTLYSMLTAIRKPEVSIITIEDPVELAIEGMSQIQIDPAKGLGFAKALKHVLRQAPNIIMVGEIRDLETMEACVACSLTGHLTLSTMHTNDAPSVIVRMLDIGVAPFLASSSLAGIVAQRLVRKLCDKCKRPTDPPPDYKLPHVEAEEVFASVGSPQFFEPVGCHECQGTGYHGMTGLFEILTMNTEMRQLVTSKGSILQISDAAERGGMRTLLESGLRKVATGVTTLDEIVRVVPLNTW